MLIPAAWILPVNLHLPIDHRLMPNTKLSGL
jgi:hypothetical protein